MSEPRRFSNSELQAWKRCKRKWYLAYVRRLKLVREDPTGARPIGTRVHAVLADYYDPTADHSLLGPLDLHDMLVFADEQEFPEKAEQIRKDADLSRAVVEGYFEWLEETGADEGLTVVAPEQKLEYEIMRGVILQGKLDLRVLREFDGARLALDHKTVGNFTEPTKSLHMDEQMKTYLMLETLCDPKGPRTDGAIYNMLRKVKRTKTAKPPFYERMEVRHNVHVMRDFYDRVVQEIGDIMRMQDELEFDPDSARWRAYPTPTKTCSWDCDYYAMCPLMDDESTNLPGLVEALYEEGDPYDRYNIDSGAGTI